MPIHDPVYQVLCDGEITVEGRMPWSSNVTLLSRVEHDGAFVRAIYKPHRGERPLWDFPAGLGKRETAAYELSEALGWNLVPHTVLRDGPHGIGSVQRFVDADFEEHYFTIYESGRCLESLRKMCIFDVLANNTDRKSGHCLISIGEEIYGIDHGLCFHEDYKVRTVIWEFGGEAIPDDLMADLRRLQSAGFPDRLLSLLVASEQDAMIHRLDALIDMATFPIDGSNHRYPWPLI